ncbi:MAG: sugar ABC transporter permease [Desulfurococcaceae archaeon]
MNRVQGKKVLFPTKIALFLVIPSIVLYVFFNTWPMLFSIGIAFTNATRENILPNPQRVSDLKNSIMCATLLKENPEYQRNASQLVDTILSRLDTILLNLESIKNQLENGVKPEDIPYLYFDNLYRIANIGLRKTRSDIVSFFNCTLLGYPTNRELIPSDILGKMDSLITLTGTLVSIYRTMTSEMLYNQVLVGYNITSELRTYFEKLDVSYEEYMSNFIESASRELDELELKIVWFENFNRLFGDPRFYNSLYKTILFVLTSVPLKVATGVLLALFYSTTLIYGRKILRALLIVPWAMPFLLSALTWKFLFLPNGQLGQLLGLNMNTFEWDAFIVYNLFETWLAYPFIMTITQGALRGVSKDIIEASYIDGADIWTRLRRVVFPQISRPVLLAAILTTGASLQAFLVPLVLNGAGPIGDICSPFTGCTAGWKNEMLIIFGYNRIMIDREFAYAASMYLIVLAIILTYVALWFRLMKKMSR